MRFVLRMLTPTSTGEVCTRPGDLQNMAGQRFPRRSSDQVG